MKTYSIILLTGALAFSAGGCGTAYHAQTPDAVYYSPTENNTAYVSSSDNNQEVTTENNNPNAGSYVSYENGYNNDNSGNYSYLDNYSGYNTQAINLFDNPDNFYAYNSFTPGSPFMYNPYYLGSPYSAGFGWGYSPFLWSYPSLSFGLGYSWGSPWAGSWYNPYAFGGWYSPFYSPYLYSPYLMNYGYYGGGYGYYYNKQGTYTPRPASAYGPRRTSNSRVYLGTSGNTTVNGSAPVRTFGNTGTGNARVIQNNRVSPERVFTANPNERPENINTNTRVAEKRPSILRIFQRNNNNNYVQPQTRQSNQEVYRPQQERTFSRPERTFNYQPPRVESSSPSYNNSSSSESAPVRTFSPRGR